MEIKFSILTQDQDGSQQNIAYTAQKEYAKKLINVLLAGIDPNNLNDIVIHPVIENKEVMG